MADDRIPVWLDLLLALWILVVGILYYRQFLPYLGIGMSYLHRVLTPP